MTKFESIRPSILQISDENKVFIIDMIALSSSIYLDQTLTKIVTNEQTVCVGFSFKADLT